jgi:hypothetical protein
MQKRERRAKLRTWNVSLRPRQSPRERLKTRRSSILGSVATLVLILAGCSNGTAAGTAGAATTNAPPASVAVPAPTVAGSAGISGSSATAAAASVAVAPIPDGTYRTKAIPVAVIVARIKTDTSLTADETANLQGFAGHKTDTIEIDLQSGQFTESDSLDGAPFEVGARATYAFPDDHTLVIQEQGPGLSTFVITPTSGGFSLKYKAGAPNTGEDIIGQAIYESSPFTLVP